MEEQNLDPKNWDSMRALGHKMIDDMINYLQDIKNQPSWKAIPDEIKKKYHYDIPEEPTAVEEIYEEFVKNILPYPKGNIHPRFWAWVQGTGTPLGVLADMMASAMNSNVAIGEHSAMYIDAQVIKWCKQMMGFPENGSGMLVSGGSLANITGLIVARNYFTEYTIRNTGLKAREKQMTIYCSTETHSCVMKGVEMIGIGHDYIRKININDNYEIKIEDLKKCIVEDIANGYEPFCIVANAGTVNTGAIDDLKAIREICDDYKMWMHIDGAFGALAKLTAEYSAQLKPIEVADSVAFDLHKWMYMPYEVGCILINDRAKHRNSFNITPSYLLNHERGLAAGPDPYNNYGMELSRGFKALKVWMSIKEHGIKKYGQLIYQNILQCREFAKMIDSHNDLELLAPVSLNVVNYRFVIKGQKDELLNKLNKDILMALQERGIASPSSTILKGRYAIRVAHVNHRTTMQDFEIMITETVKIGREIFSKL